MSDPAGTPLEYDLTDGLHRYGLSGLARVLVTTTQGLTPWPRGKHTRDIAVTVWDGALDLEVHMSEHQAEQLMLSLVAHLGNEIDLRA